MAGLLQGLVGQEAGCTAGLTAACLLPPASCQVPRQGSSCRRGPPLDSNSPRWGSRARVPLGPPWETPRGLSWPMQVLKVYSTFTSRVPIPHPRPQSPSDRWGN